MSQSLGYTGTSVTYSPYTGKIYQGSLKDEDFSRDTALPALARYNADRKMGDGRYEVVDMGADLYKKAGTYQAAVDETSLGNITVIPLLGEVIRRLWRNRVAVNGTKRTPVPKLQLDVPVYTKYDAQEEVEELQRTDSANQKFTQVPLRLKKNVAHIFESDEAQFKATIAPLEFGIDQAAGALEKVANTQAATAIEGFTAQAAGGAWNVLNTDDNFHPNNPMDDLAAAYNTITGNEFIPDTVAMNPLVATAYGSNTNIKGYQEIREQMTIGEFSLKDFPGVRALVDPSFSTTTATIYDSTQGVLMGEGPIIADQYRDYERDATVWKIRQYIQFKKTTNDAGRKITGARS